MLVIIVGERSKVDVVDIMFINGMLHRSLSAEREKEGEAENGVSEKFKTVKVE